MPSLTIRRYDSGRKVVENLIDAGAPIRWKSGRPVEGEEISEQDIDILCPPENISYFENPEPTWSWE